MSFHPLLAKRTMILLQVSRGPLTKIDLARALGYAGAQGVAKDVNALIKDGKLSQDNTFKCPHCDQEIPGLSLKKDGLILRLTETGQREVKQARESLKEMLKDG